ncbi:MAG TPA: LysM peptidoglycan-binding domain-containing protein [Chloroflexia bacterium]|nr:LysM peptidoglycan-binding domain-containing protein [Chloroflexia bacterium]
MPEALNIKKAVLQELDAKGEKKGDPVTVQFNPETLKVSFSNQVVPPTNTNNRAGDQRGTASIQYVGKGATKLSVQLWFDVTAEADYSREKDVRKLTEKVAYFIKPQKVSGNKQVAPAVRFLWGTFKFDGIVESMEESLEFFSNEGVPLRASVTLSLTQTSFQFQFEALGPAEPNASPPGASNGVGNSAPPGTQPLTPAPQGVSLQSLAAGLGVAWQAIAEANGIENPRLLSPGQLINLDAGINGGSSVK